jgi:hypothetical protein
MTVRQSRETKKLEACEIWRVRGDEMGPVVDVGNIFEPVAVHYGQAGICDVMVRQN